MESLCDYIGDQEGPFHVIVEICRLVTESPPNQCDTYRKKALGLEYHHDEKSKFIICIVP